MARIANSEQGRRWSERLRAALAAAGWQVEADVPVPGTGSRVDLVARKGPRTYVIEVKVAHERRAGLTAVAAEGLLQARAYSRGIGGSPLVVVCGSQLSAARVQAVREFLGEVGEGAFWGVLDDYGLELHGPDLEDVEASPAKARSPRHEPALTTTRPSDLFSDLSQWCLKVLLSHLLPPALQLASHGVRITRPIDNATDLARVAHVSGPTAWRTIHALQEDGLLDRVAPLAPLDLEMLMTRWRASYLRPVPEIRARWLLPASASPLERLVTALHRAPSDDAPGSAIGLFAAAEVLGYGFVRGVAPHLLERAPSAESLERLGLIAAGPGERVDVFVRRPIAPKSTFRGVSSVRGVPVTDIIQVWLDVSSHPARGREMSDFLARALPRLFPTEAHDEAVET